MPELPEVENVRKSLVMQVKGKTIQSVSIHWPKIIKHPLEYEQFQDALVNQTIRDVQRQGKFLIFILDDYALVSHLRMEGNYSLHQAGDEIDKHTHIIFHFSDETQLHYRDVRKFGTMHLFAKGTEGDVLPLSKLGPEPFSPNFTIDYFKERLMKTTRYIKAVLLDQTVVTGLGNIYVDEVLFRSKVHPERRANTLNDEEIAMIREQTIATLNESIEAGGSSVNTYMNSLGLSGTYQERLLVYGRNNQQCKECGDLLEKVKLAGRGTHFCPGCQKSDGR